MKHIFATIAFVVICALTRVNNAGAAEDSTMNEDQGLLRFWGVRDEIPVSASWTSEYGGNTACIELRLGHVLNVIDAGTGLYLLGDTLRSTHPLDVNIFLTHTHLDRLIGFPSFQPLDSDDSTIHIISPQSFAGKLDETISSLMEFRYFPVKLAWKKAKIEFRELGLENRYDFGDFTVQTLKMNHPAITVGYRFEYNNKVIVIASDNEPYTNLFLNAGSSDDADYREADTTVKEERQKLADFIRGADILVFDATFFDQEYSSFQGNGHGPIGYAVQMASESGAKRLILYPHHPSRSDETLHIMEDTCQKKLTEIGSSIECICAKEGLEIRF